jgi:hypothetical protein
MPQHSVKHSVKRVLQVLHSVKRVLQVLHASPPNTADDRRCAFSITYVNTGAAARGRGKGKGGRGGQRERERERENMRPLRLGSAT